MRIPQFSYRLVALISLCGVLGMFGAFGATAVPGAETNTPQGASTAAPPAVLRAVSFTRGASETAVRNERWLPPLGAPLRVSAPYVAPAHAYGPGHRGIDLSASLAAEVHAPVAGEVSFVGTVVDRPLISLRVDAHTVVSIEPVASTLAVGDRVQRGEIIGVRAHGGHCDDSCLHLGVRVDGDYVNPMRFFVGRPVLLPLN